MHKHKLYSTFVLLATVVLAVSCRNSHENNQSSHFQFTDDYGNTVDIPTNPKRVVSLSPAVTEIMYAIGADSLLVGRTEFCKYPPEAASIENIGGISNMNIEKVLSLNPDLIISGSMIPQRVVEKIESMGVPMVCVIEKQHFDALYDNIAAIGKLVGHTRQADSLIDILHGKLSTIDTTSPLQRKTVYYVVGYGSGGNFTAGGNTFINDIINMAGGANIAADSQGWTFSVEALISADPDFILIRKEDSASFCRTTPYNKLSAIRNNHIIAFEDGMLDLQVPRNLEAIVLMRNKITQ